MAQSSSETTTATPTVLSPFSSSSNPSEATSDELPDLGAFTTVFRALNHLHPPRAFSLPFPTNADPSDSVASSSQASSVLSPLEFDSEAGVSTVWARLPLMSYFVRSNATAETQHESPSVLPQSVEQYASGSDTEGEPSPPRTVEIEVLSDIDIVGDQPSLGYLDEALSFIAAERARFAAQREQGVKDHSSTSDSAWRHVVEPRRKRRRKKSAPIKPVQILSREVLTEDISAASAVDVAPDQDADDDSSSSFDQSYTNFKSTPATPPQIKAEKENRRVSAINNNPKLSHSKSTPSLRLPLAVPLDPQVLRLRTLAHKLRLLFPEDAKTLSAVLSAESLDDSDFVDPRGPAPRPKDTLTHVFIDHSNILIGLINHQKRVTGRNTRGIRMSHEALSLILERGRPITRRVLVTSSPLYQPIDVAEKLGYDVRIYMRVPDNGDGQDRKPNSEFTKGSYKKNASSSFTKSHSRKLSGNTSTESDQANGSHPTFSNVFTRGMQKPSRPAPNPLNSQTNGASTSNSHSNTSGTTQRIKYREQGVDELLQLKLHQAIADVDVPPPNATIILATGDGNVGQFNEDGFLGPVRTALKKGWRVELYAWEDGLSKAWKREFSGKFGDRFKVVGMEQFGADLTEI